MKRSLLSFIAALATVLALGAQAQQPDQAKPQTPATLKGGQVVDAKAVKQLVDTKGASFFDMRSAVNYGKGHLAGSKALPYREASEYKEDFDAAKDQFDLKALPADKAAKIVFYSDGPTGWKSYKAAVLAIKGGYTNVHYFRGGTTDWLKAGYPLAK